MKGEIFWAGFSLFVLQFIGVFVYFLTGLDWSWFLDNAMLIVGLGILGSFNLACLILMLYGLLSKEEKVEVPEYY